MKKRLTFHQLLFEQQILGILLFTILVVFLWVISSIYFSYSESTLSKDDTITVVPLTPTIPDKPLQDLNARKWWTDEELNQFTVSVVLDDKSTGSISGPATSSALLTPTPSTQSAVPTTNL